MVRRVLRFPVPVDGSTTQIPAGTVLHLGRRSTPAAAFGFRADLEVWVETEAPDDWPASDPAGPLRTVGLIWTAAAVPAGAQHLASAEDGGIVVHLYELEPAP